MSENDERLKPGLSIRLWSLLGGLGHDEFLRMVRLKQPRLLRFPFGRDQVQQVFRCAARRIQRGSGGRESVSVTAGFALLHKYQIMTKNERMPVRVGERV